MAIYALKTRNYIFHKPPGRSNFEDVPSSVALLERADSFVTLARFATRPQFPLFDDIHQIHSPVNIELEALL